MGSNSKIVDTLDAKPTETSPGLTREWILDDKSARELSQSVVGTSRKSAPSTRDEQPRTSQAPKSQGNYKERIRSISTERLAENLVWKDPAPHAKLAILLAISFAVGVGASALWRNPSAGITNGQQPKTTAGSPQGSDGQARPGVESSSPLNSPDSFTLAPTVAVIQCKPGETISRSLTFYNPSSSELTFEAVAQDVLLRNGKVEFFRAGALQNGIAATAMFSERYFNVKPRGSRSISVSLTVHPRTSSQGVLIQFRGTDKVPLNRSFGLTPTLGALLVITIAGEPSGDSDTADHSFNSSLTTFTASQWTERSTGEANTPNTGDSGTVFLSAPGEKGGSQP